MTGVLDNYVWHSLRAQARLAAFSDNGLAAIYLPDVSPFCAMADRSSAAWQGLSEILDDRVGILFWSGPSTGGARVRTRTSTGGARVRTRTSTGGARVRTKNDLTLPELPSSLELVGSEVVTQFVARALAPAPSVDLVPLGVSDVPAMIALTQLTEPGPFAGRTREFGRYWGVFEPAEGSDRRLIAMAGERMSCPGWVEVSAVCVHPDARRRGLGGTLTLAVAAEIRRDGNEAMLHVREGNDPALALYKQLGFVVRAEHLAIAVQKPGNQNSSGPVLARAPGS